MVPSHGLLRSRVNRQQIRFESSSLVSEMVFECCSSELGTLRDLRSTDEMGRSCMKAIQKYFILPEALLGEMQMCQGWSSIICRGVSKLFSRYFIPSREIVDIVDPNLCAAP